MSLPVSRWLSSDGERSGWLEERGFRLVDINVTLEKVRELIGYDPQFPLQKGFERYVRWYKFLANEIGVVWRTPRPT